jgi:hypothetical protein
MQQCIIVCKHTEAVPLFYSALDGRGADGVDAMAYVCSINKRHASQALCVLVLLLLLLRQVLPYELLQNALAIATVRDLEDFIISDCFYTGAQDSAVWFEG